MRGQSEATATATATKTRPSPPPPSLLAISSSGYNVGTVMTMTVDPPQNQQQQQQEGDGGNGGDEEGGGMGGNNNNNNNNSSSNAPSPPALTTVRGGSGSGNGNGRGGGNSSRRVNNVGDVVPGVSSPSSSPSPPSPPPGPSTTKHDAYQQEEDDGDDGLEMTDYDPGPGCRPFCSSPFGHSYSGLLSLLGLFVCALSLIPIFSCNFMTPNFVYCFPPDPKYDDFYDQSSTCWTYNEQNVGLFFAEVVVSGTGLSSKIDIGPDWFESYEDSHYTGFYGKCKSYNMRNSLSGFWHDVRYDYMGGVYVLACVMAGIAMGCGLALGVAGCMVWCVAFHARTIRVITVTALVGGVCEILTLLFMTTGVCDGDGQGGGGCKLQFAGVTSIVASLTFFISCFGWHRLSTTKYNMTQLPIQCCCCPQFQPEQSGGITEVVMQRTYFPDGSFVVEKTTVMSTGFTRVSRTTCLPDREVIVDIDVDILDNVKVDDYDGVEPNKSNRNMKVRMDTHAQKQQQQQQQQPGRRRSVLFSPSVTEEGTETKSILIRRRPSEETLSSSKADLTHVDDDHKQDHDGEVDGKQREMHPLLL